MQRSEARKTSQLSRQCMDGNRFVGVSSCHSTPTGGGNGGTGSTGSAPAGGDQASLEEWINYLKDYDKNVENGVESATDDFTDMIGSVGDSMANGNYGEGAQEFNDGLKDYVGDIFGSLTP